MNVYFRLSNNEDPEERLEDAALWKALYDEYGDEITLLPQNADIPDEGVFFGRTKKGEMYTASGNERMDYWSDPAYHKYAAREVIPCDVEEAEALVRKIHESGRDAFVKAMERKYFTGKIDRGRGFSDKIRELVYSFLDRGQCLLVQPWCDMVFEQRFLFINRELVARSPVAYHLTPIDQLEAGTFYMKPSDKSPVFEPSADLTKFAKLVASECQYNNVNIDCAWIDGKPGVIEYNDIHPGQLGLYACDVRALARATRSLSKEGGE